MMVRILPVFLGNMWIFFTMVCIQKKTKEYRCSEKGTEAFDSIQLYGTLPESVIDLNMKDFTFSKHHSHVK